MLKEIFLINTSHVDMTWWDTPEACERRIIEVMDAALDLAAKDPDFRFSAESAYPLYLYTLKRPERIAELKAALASGRIDAGGLYVAPVSDYCFDELLYRNFAYGKLWLLRELGYDALVAREEDSPGHTMQFPQLARGFGMKYARFSRGPFGLFRWRSPGGAEVLAFTAGYSFAYYPRLGASIDEKISKGLPQRIAQVEDTGNSFDAVMFPDGDDNALPNPHGPELAAAWNKKNASPAIKCATVTDFFLAADRFDAPVHTGDIPNTWAHIATFQPDAFLHVKKLRALLPAVEMLLSSAPQSDKKNVSMRRIGETWRTLLECLDHNWGGRLQGAYGLTGDLHKLARLAAASDCAEAELRTAADSLFGIHLNTDDEINNFIIINTLSCERSEPVEMRLPNPFAQASTVTMNAVFPDGSESPVQFIDDDAPNNKRIVFHAPSVPPCGWTSFRLVPRGIPRVHDPEFQEFRGHDPNPSFDSGSCPREIPVMSPESFDRQQRQGDTPCREKDEKGDRLAAQNAADPVPLFHPQEERYSATLDTSFPRTRESRRETNTSTDYVFSHDYSKNTPFEIENGFYKIKVSKTGAGIESIFDKQLRREILPDPRGRMLDVFGVSLHLNEIWSLGFRFDAAPPGFYDDSRNEGKMGEQAVVTGEITAGGECGCELLGGADGPVFTSLRTRIPFIGGSSVEQEIRIYHNSKRIDLNTRIDWAGEENRLVCIAFPFGPEDGRFSMDVPFGMHEFGKEVPGFWGSAAEASPLIRNAARIIPSSTKRWLRASFLEEKNPFLARAKNKLASALMKEDSAASRGLYNWLDRSGGGWGAALHTSHAPFDFTFTPAAILFASVKNSAFFNGEHYLRRGRHEFTFSLTSHEGGAPPAHLHSAGRFLSNPLITLPAVDAGHLPRTASLIRCNDPRIVITSVRPDEDGESVAVRYYNTSDKRVEAVFLSDHEIDSANIVDMLGNESGAITMKDKKTFAIETGACGIGNIRFSFKTAYTA